MDFITYGKYTTIHCFKQYNYLIDNILQYYDTEEYKDILFYIPSGFFEFEIVYRFNKIIVYNVEHLSYYTRDLWDDFFDMLIERNVVVEFWDFDISNYQTIMYYHPAFAKCYKFKPLRYVDFYKKVDTTIPKKYDAIQIGTTRYMSTYRNNIFWNFSKNHKYVDDFSLLDIEMSKYSLSELYDEINNSKVVLNIPRLQGSGQEQVRIGQLLSMNCTVATQTNKISYLEDFVHEVDFRKENILDEIRNLEIKNDIAEKFKDETFSDESYKKYTQKCLEKWYSYKTSYLYSVVIVSINKEGVEKTLTSLQQSSIFDRLQILVVDISDDERIETFLTNHQCKNIQYIKSETNSIVQARNLGIQYAVGKYLYFINSGNEVYYNYFEKLLKYFENNKDTKIAISSYYRNNNYYDLKFEILQIGPLLSCCVFDRSIVNILFEDCLCSDIIFTGILCKNNGYDYISYEEKDPYISYVVNDEYEKFFEPKNVPADFDWIAFTQNKINE